MARYGGGSEDYKAEAEKIAAMRKGRVALSAAEIQGKDAAKALGTAEDTAAAATERTTKLRRERNEVAKRSEKAVVDEVKVLDADTAAIKRNTAAREQAAAAAKRFTPNMGSALRGARDPLLGQAIALGEGGVPSQYALRRELGIGQSRATGLKHAVGAGFTPGDPGASGPITRIQGMSLQVERAEAAYAEATRQLAASRRRKADTDEDRLHYAAQKEAADAARKEAKAALESARSAEALSAARKEGTVAAQVAAREDQARKVGTGLILHPTASGLGAPGGVRTIGTEAFERNGLNRSPGYGAPIGPVNAPAGNTTAERSYLHSLTQERRAYIQALRDQAVVKGGVLVGAETASVAALQREGTALGTVSQAMHKHGALTSEFILAASRGETTLKELGNQALITAGKFGGWTAAATALYAAAGAIGQVGKGALDANAGVAQLRRVLTDGFKADDATAGFAALSKEFNVPIETVTDAVYRMGQRFHTLPDAMKAARASLYSFKTGEVDVESSTKNLLAVVAGFGLEASDLEGVYDKINNAQNTFGVRIQDTEEGLAKSAGAFRNAGGDLDYLLSLFVAINKQTGQTGNVIGTAMARAVSQIRIPSHIDTLKALGIDVDPDNLEKTIKSTIERARSGALRSSQLNQAANAIFGNQYGRLLSPLLRDAATNRDDTTLNKAIDANPKAQGSAARELAQTLKAAREQLTAIGLGLQRIGAELSRAGAFDVAGALLKGLNETLHTAERLLHIYNEIPGPLRHALTILLEMGVAVKALQRFGALEGIAGGILASPDSRLRVRAVRGARDFRDNAFDESERTGQRSAAAAHAAERARIQGVRFSEEATAARGRFEANPSDATMAQSEKADLRVLRAEAQHVRLAERSALLAEEANDARAIAASADAAYVETQKVHASQMRSYIAAQQRAIPVETDAPSTKGVEYLPGSGPGTLGGGAAQDFTERAPRETSQRVRRFQGSLNNWYANWRVPLATLGETNTSARTGARVLDAAATRTISGATRTAELVGRVGTKLKSVGPRMGALAGAFGPLDVALLAFFAGEAVSAAADKLNADLDTAEKYLNSYTGSSQKQQKEFAAKSKRIIQEGEARSRPGDLGEIVDKTFKFPSTIAKSLRGEYETPREKRQRLADEAIDEQLNQSRRKVLQDDARRRKAPVAELTFDQLIQSVTSDQAKRKKGLIDQREFDRRMANHAVEAKILLNANSVQTERAREAVAQAQAAQGGTKTGFAESLRHISDQAVDAQLQSVQTNLTQDNSSRNVDRLRTVYQEYRKRYGRRAGQGDPKAIQALAGARDAYYSSLTSQSQNELALANSRTADPLVQANNNLRAARRTVDRAKSVYGVHSQQYRQALADLNTARQQQAQAILANVEADNALLIAQAGNDPAAQARVAVTAAQNTLNALQAHSKTVDPNAIKQARAQLITARNQQAQQQKDEGNQIAQLEGQLATAQAGGDPVAAARAQLTTARRALNGAKTRTERLQAQVDLVTAQNALQDALKGQQDAKFQLQASQTDDPVALARIEEQRTKAAINGTTGTARIQAQAAHNQAVRALHSARLQAREDDVQFELDMGKITIQDAIDRYNAMLKAKDLTKAEKRDLQQKVKSLKDQASQASGGFDLDVGSIKLPTIYDVRRAFDPIRKQVTAQQREAAHQLRSHTMSIGDTVARNSTADVRNSISNLNDISSNVQAQVNVYVNDQNAAGEVYSAIDRVMKTTVRAKMRSRRYR